MYSTRSTLTVAALAIAGLVVLAVIIAGTVGYVRVYKPMLRPIGFIGASVRLEETIENQRTYTPPSSGELTSDQWSRFCDVKSAVRAAIGSSMAEVEQQKQALLATAEKNPAGVPYRAALGAVGEIGPAFLTAKNAQVQALNRARFSIEEYRWVQRQVFASAGLALAELDIASMNTAPQERRDVIEVKTSTALEVSRALRDRVLSRDKAELESWRALAFFGL
jgi:predicted transglutaminase-like cysteine proteinase